MAVRMIFMGTPHFAVPALRALHDCNEYELCGVYTQPDRPSGRGGKKIIYSPVKQQALEYGIPIYQPLKLRELDATAMLAALKPDIIVVAAYGQILAREILTMPKYGCINIHASLLPAYRGAAPIHRAVMNGETSTGVSIMCMAEGIDTGPVLSTARVDIGSLDTTGIIHDKLMYCGARLLVGTLRDWIAGSITPVEQDDKIATYAAKISKSDEKLDWNSSCRDIANHVRGLNPWPGAYTMLGESVLKVWRTEECRDIVAGHPGEVVRLDRSGIYVSCIGGIIKLTEVQPAGGARMDASAFINSKKIQTGDYLV